MEKTLYISDLDGTLLGGESILTDTTVSLLNRAIAEGALFSIATARTPSTVAWLMRDVDIRVPMIVMTGVALWDMRKRDYLNKVTMPEEVAEEILAIIRAHNLPSFIYTMSRDMINVYHTGELSDLEKEFISFREKTPYKTFHIEPDGTSKIPHPLKDVIIFYAMQPSMQTAAAYHDVCGLEHCSPLYYHDLFGEDTGIMEVFDRRATKANALRKLKEMTGATRVVAFGDNINDIPMLKEADVAVAMENAVDEVKAVADVIIGPNTEDSVAKYILAEIRNHKS